MNELNFKEFMTVEPANFGETDDDIVMMYMTTSIPVREICKKCNRSIGEVYRLLKARSCPPSRKNTKHNSVYSLADAGFSIPSIAEFTGYTPRNVRYILSKRLNED